MKIRDARPDDAEGLAAIHNDAVLRTRAVWSEATVDAVDRAAWVESRQADGFPVVVVEEGDEVLGYGSYGQWRPWDGYRYTVEHSVYVRADQRGRGLGRLLLQELIDRASAGGVHVMVAAIEGGNAGSIALHEKLGFEHVGFLPQVGAKFGEWLDLVFLQLILDGRPHPA